MESFKGRHWDRVLTGAAYAADPTQGVVVDRQPVPLTENEIAVTQTTARGLTLAQAAAELGFSVDSATLFRHWAMRKAGVANPAALVAIALANGWISAPKELIYVQPETGHRSRRGDQSGLEIHQARCPLTERQLQVIRGLALGLPISRIADLLELAEITVRNHIQRARGRLNASNRVGLAVAAISDGWIPPPPEHLRMGQPGVGEEAASNGQLAYVVDAEI